MPAQNFSLNEATAALASVQWSAGYSTVDLTYNGVLLTRITDAQSLRTTGLQGTTADGATLVLRLLPGVTGEDFSLERNGARMHAGPIDHFALSPSAVFQSPAAAADVMTPAQEKSMLGVNRSRRNGPSHRIISPSRSAAIRAAAGSTATPSERSAENTGSSCSGPTKTLTSMSFVARGIPYWPYASAPPRA